MLGLTFPVRWKSENTLLLQRGALPGPWQLKEQGHSIQGEFAEPCILALRYGGGVWERQSATLRLSGVTFLQVPSTMQVSGTHYRLIELDPKT